MWEQRHWCTCWPAGQITAGLFGRVVWHIRHGASTTGHPHQWEPFGWAHEPEFRDSWVIESEMMENLSKKHFMKIINQFFWIFTLKKAARCLSVAYWTSVLSRINCWKIGNNSASVASVPIITAIGTSEWARISRISCWILNILKIINWTLNGNLRNERRPLAVGRGIRCRTAETVLLTISSGICAHWRQLSWEWRRHKFGAKFLSIKLYELHFKIKLTENHCPLSSFLCIGSNSRLITLMLCCCGCSPFSLPLFPFWLLAFSFGLNSSRYSSFEFCK